MLISAMNMRCYRLKSASNALSTIRLIVSLITLLHPLAFLITSCNYNSFLCRWFDRSIHQGLGLKFPCYGLTDEFISYLLFGLFIMDLSLRSIKTNNSKNTSHHVILVSGYLSIDNKMVVHKDAHYQIKYSLFIPRTPRY